MNIEKINKTSLTNIIPFVSKYKNLDTLAKSKLAEFRNIILAQNGLFLLCKSNFGYIVEQIDGIRYDNSALLPIENTPIVKTYCDPLPDLSVFNQIIEIFKYVHDKARTEFLLNVYFDKIYRTYIIDIPEEQKITSASIDYKSTVEYEKDARYIKYLQIHSHGALNAFFSGTDDKDEKNKQMHIYGVVGNLDVESISEINMKFRIWSGEKFVNIDFNKVFNAPKINLPHKFIRKIDQIIEKNKSIIKIDKAIKKLDNFYINGKSWEKTISFDNIPEDLLL